MRALLFASSIMLSAALAGCQSVKCGEGTFKDGDQCVGFDPNDKTPPNTTITPPGGRSRAALPPLVTLTTDETATIYYTTDGSDPDPMSTPGHRDMVTIVGITQGTTIKYFAVDPAGNKETAKSALFASDTTPPAPVTNLTVTITNGTTAHVTWTNPSDADFTGVLLARDSDIIDVQPTAGQIYTQSSPPLSPSLAIATVGVATSFDDPSRPPGPARYVAWTYDDLGNYSAPVAGIAQVALGALTAQLTYNTTNNTFTVVSGPANLDISGSSATYSGTTLTVTLVVKNNTAKYFTYPKAEITSVTNGTFGNSDGTADALPFRALGPIVFAPGTTLNRDLTFTGVAAGTTATINLTFASHPAIVTSFAAGGRDSTRVGLVDSGSGLSTNKTYESNTAGPNDVVGGRVAPPHMIGGHYLYFATSHASIEGFDLATGMPVHPAVVGNGDRLNLITLIPRGAELLALGKHAGHRNAGALELFRFDEGLHLLGSVVLPISDDKGVSKPGLSADGNTLAVATSSGMVLVDLVKMAVIDPDLSTPDIELVDVGLSGAQVRSVTFLPNGNLFVLARKTAADGTVASVMQPIAAGYTTTLVKDTLLSTKVYAGTLAPDGRVWYVLQAGGGVHAFDPANNSIAATSYPSTTAPYGIGVINGQLWVTRSTAPPANSPTPYILDQVSATGAVQRSVNMPTYPYNTTGAPYCYCSPQPCSCTYGAYEHFLSEAQ